MKVTTIIDQLCLGSAERLVVDLLRHFPENGLALARDPDARLRLGAAARRFALDRLDIRRTAREYQELYRTLLDGAAGR